MGFIGIDEGSREGAGTALADILLKVGLLSEEQHDGFVRWTKTEGAGI